MARLRVDRILPAALVLAACLGAAGCGEGGGPPEPSRPASDVQQAQRDTAGGDVRAEGGDGGDAKNGEDGEDGESVRAEGGSSSQSSSVTQSQSGSGDQSSSIVQRSSGSDSVSSSSSSVPGVKTFSGSGSTRLSFNVEEPSRFAWTNGEGRSFSARGGGLTIKSSAGRGEVALEPGSYDDVEVRGSKWTIVVRPR